MALGFWEEFCDCVILLFVVGELEVTGDWFCCQHELSPKIEIAAIKKDIIFFIFLF